MHIRVRRMFGTVYHLTSEAWDGARSDSIVTASVDGVGAWMLYSLYKRLAYARKRALIRART